MIPFQQVTKKPLFITRNTKAEVNDILDRMEKEWEGLSYDLLKKNCCHFSDAFLIELGVKPCPRWVLNLADAGANLSETVDLGKRARGAEMDSAYQVGDYTRGSLASIAARGKRARGMQSSASLHFLDFPLGVAKKIVGKNGPGDITIQDMFM